MSAITTISAWLCKCGTGVKVISECDHARPDAKQAVACPSCGDTQLVFADKIISITDDTFNSIARQPSEP